jgi:magnesium-transporting ATPase (P-type)
VNSEWGSLYTQLASQQPVETPLQEQLRKLGRRIGYFGISIAGLLFLILVARFIYREVNDGQPFETKNLRILIHYALQAVSIVVVAVPEGLPLAVTLSLAYSMKSMLRDHNLVRHLNACETTGGATSMTCPLKLNPSWQTFVLTKQGPSQKTA